MMTSTRPATNVHHVEDLVPHRGPMSWLDRVLHVDADRIAAEADVHPANFFVRDGQLDVWVGIEYMAQAVAAWAGYRARQQGRTVALGFLVGTRRYEVHCQGFAVGTRLHIEAACELMADNGLGMFSCVIRVDGQVAASAKLSVFEPPDGVAFLESQIR